MHTTRSTLKAMKTGLNRISAELTGSVMLNAPLSYEMLGYLVNSYGWLVRLYAASCSGEGHAVA
jgi:hypothetical protein